MCCDVINLKTSLLLSEKWKVNELSLKIQEIRFQKKIAKAGRWDALLIMKEVSPKPIKFPGICEKSKLVNFGKKEDTKMR